VAFQEPGRIRAAEGLGLALAVACLRACPDALAGEFRLVGIGRQHRGDLGDDGVVAVGAGFGGVGNRLRHRGAQLVDEVPVDAAREQEGEVRLGFGDGVHGRHYGVSLDVCQG
jgi:hypothetical protein